MINKKMKKKQKKGTRAAIELEMLAWWIIALILLVLVAVIVLIWRFDDSILAWIKGLPEYRFKEDEVVDVGELGEDEEIKIPKTCSDYWEDLKSKTYTMEFLKKCGPDKNNLVDFKERGTCCVELTNEYLEIKDEMKSEFEDLKWSWIALNEEACEDFKQNYNFYLKYSDKTKSWKVELHKIFSGSDEYIYFIYGGSDCGDPTGKYDCGVEPDDYLEKGAVVVKEGAHCGELLK